jgi:hypothetical protein
MPKTSASNRVLTDPDEIRQWVEQRGGRPTCVRGTGSKDDVGLLRIDFPGYSGENSLEEVGWDEWLEKFDEQGLALIVQDRTAGGQRSNFNKIVSRETAESSGRRSGRNGASGSSRKSGSSRRRTASRSRSGGRSTAAKTTSRVGSRSSGRSSSQRKGAASARSSSRSSGNKSRRRAA